MPGSRRRRRFFKPLLALVAFVALAVVLSACTFFKNNSLSLSQPAGIGSVRVHFSLCGELGEEDDPPCDVNETNGEPATQQSILGIAVPPGASAPATITATPTSGGPALVYTRSDQAAQSIAEASLAINGEIPPVEVWPPAGTEGVGYVSSVYTEEDGLREWNVDADFGLPAGQGAGPYPGPFVASIWVGSRFADAKYPADRPVHCARPPGAASESDAFCEPGETKELGISDLKIGQPATASAFVGGQATLQFGLDFASTASSLPSFNVTAASTLPGAGLAVSSPTFTPPAPAADTRRSSDTETVTVTVPSNAAPGTYDVTLTASSGGGTVSQVAKLEVAKLSLKLGKVKLNKKNGTATIFVGVTTAGTLTASGAKIVRAQRKASGPATLKVTIRAKGKAKRLLREKGKAKVRTHLTFGPTSGAPVVKSKAIILKKTLAG